MRLRRAFFARDPLEVAPELLGKILVAGDRSGRIVEVEAYRGVDDPGSHGYRGVTPRTRVMFGPAGHLYVYLSYGMHWCANVVCGDEGECAAVLLRALSPIRGVEAMYAHRAAARRDRDLCSGPAKLCQSMGITGDHDGINLATAEEGMEIILDPSEEADRADWLTSPRVGLGEGKGDELPWRFYLPGDPNVSASR